MLEAFLDSEKKGYFAYEAFKKFEDPHKMEWYCCPKKCMRVTPVKAHERTVDGRKTWVVAHFRRIDEKEASCYYGESDIHKACKMLIAALFEDGILKLSVGGIVINPRSLKIKRVRPEFRWELHGKLERYFRRADVGVEMATFNPLLGKGIAFEVQLSKIERREIEEREKFWIEAGYSVVWVPIDLFDLREYVVNPENPIEISLPWIVGRIKYLEETILHRIACKAEVTQSEIKSCTNKLENLLKEYIRRQETLLERVEVLKKLAYSGIPSNASCANCKYSGRDKYEGKLVCWRAWREAFVDTIMESGILRDVIKKLEERGYYIEAPPFPVSQDHICRFWKRG